MLQLTCTSPPTDTGLVQPGNEEMISLSVAAVGTQAIYNARCCVSCLQGKNLIQWIHSVKAKNPNIFHGNDFSCTYWHIVYMLIANNDWC